MTEEQSPPPTAEKQLEQKGVDESADTDMEKTGKIDVDGKGDKTKASGTDIPFMIPVIEDVQEETVVDAELEESEIANADDGDFLWDKVVRDSIGTPSYTRTTTGDRNEREKQDVLASQENKSSDNRSMLEIVTTGGMKAKSETDEQSKDSKKNEAASNEAPAVGSTTIVSCNQMIDQTGVSTISVNDAQAVAGEGWSDGISMDMELARGFFSLQQMDSATVYFSKVIETGSTQIWEARLFLARIAIWKDNPEKARILLKQVIAGATGKVKKQAEDEIEKLDKE
jgi:phage terminase large subunit-like protein